MRIGKLLAILIFISSCHLRNDFVKAERIKDGDTIVLTNGEIVRLYSIDTPELTQAWGKEAKAFTTSYLLRQNIKIERIGKDKYHRTIAKVFLSDGTYFNHLLVKMGQAHCSYKYCKDKKLIEEMETARKNKIGLWQYANVPPFIFRKVRKK